jgi:hypothetical protein
MFVIAFVLIHHHWEMCSFTAMLFNHSWTVGFFAHASLMKGSSLQFQTDASAKVRCSLILGAATTLIGQNGS